MITGISASIAVASIVTALTSPAAGTPASPRQQTCAAYAQYQQHPSLGALQTVVRDSFRLPGRTWLAADVGWLWADAVSPGSKAQFVAADRRYVADDCRP